MIKKIVMGLMVLVAANAVQANNGNDGFVTVTNFQLWSNTYNEPQIRVVISGDTYYNPSGCSNLDSYMVSTALTDKIQDRIYSVLLSAALAKKSVILRIESNGCENNRPRIMSAIIQ